MTQSLQNVTNMSRGSGANIVYIDDFAIGPYKAQQHVSLQHTLAWRRQEIEAYKRVQRESAHIPRSQPPLAKHYFAIGERQGSATHARFE
ncbi:MAG TPA: hypothetical protein VFX76_13345 [Roseiflexaceae bacterium]|nr:hypothetical protein [Roseiflexaceae bacterium]